MASLLAAILVGWFLLQKLQPELQPTMEYAIVLRYSVEIKDEKTRATSFSLTSGKPFRLHFTPQTDGYLYLLAPDENQVMRIYLNAQPVKANSDFADEWFTPDPKSKQGNITAIFSSEPIPLLKSLPTNPGSELGDQHLKDLENLRKQAASSSPILRDFTNFTNFTNGNAPSVFVTAAKSGQPVVFDITPEGK